MRIAKFGHVPDCREDGCVMNYCRPCRVLFYDCVTAVRTLEGDPDVIHGLHPVWEITTQCPKCGK